MIHRSGYRPRSTQPTAAQSENTAQANPEVMVAPRLAWSDFVYRGIDALSGILLSIVPKAAGRSMVLDTGPSIDLGPAPVVVTRQFRPGIAAPTGPTSGAGLGFPGNGSMLHVAHYPVYSRPAGKVAMGPKSSDDNVTVPAVFVGGPLS